jgi:hypothetical protein
MDKINSNMPARGNQRCLGGTVDVKIKQCMRAPTYKATADVYISIAKTKTKDTEIRMSYV